MKNILFIATGGTIACHRTDEGLSPLLSSEELLSFVPDTKDYCETDTIQLFNLDSTNIRPEHWTAIVQCIESHYPAYDGFVISHGTDTMAYTAAALSYMIQNTAKPVVITGAQKPIDMDNTDARTNLADSLLYASDPLANGVSIVFGGKVINGTHARKMRTKSYNAFSSINYPPVAVIQDGTVIYFIPPAAVTGEPIFYYEMDRSVCVIKIIPGMDPALLQCISGNYNGIILESFGVGGIPEGSGHEFHNCMEQLLSDGKTIVMATQVIHEGSDLGVYKVGHRWKEQYQLLETYDMTLEATVTKLMWILAQTSDPENIRALFYKAINHDMLFPHKETTTGTLREPVL